MHKANEELKSAFLKMSQIQFLKRRDYHRRRSKTHEQASQRRENTVISWQNRKSWSECPFCCHQQYWLSFLCNFHACLCAEMNVVSKHYHLSVSITKVQSLSGSQKFGGNREMLVWLSSGHMPDMDKRRIFSGKRPQQASAGVRNCNPTQTISI